MVMGKARRPEFNGNLGQKNGRRRVGAIMPPLFLPEPSFTALPCNKQKHEQQGDAEAKPAGAEEGAEESAGAGAVAAAAGADDDKDPAEGLYDTDEFRMVRARFCGVWLVCDCSKQSARQ
jgi:hypothetical protein